jgi:tetratricopeptide (TPR) repeat protein
MLAEMPQDWKEQNAAIADGFHAMPFELLIRFGRWEELLAEPEPPAYFPIARALRHAARGVAFAALGRLPEAHASEKAFQEAVVKTPKEAAFGNNTAAALFAVAEAMLRGEILVQEGKRQEGLAALREAVRREDQLRYDEPPDWIQPVRHALGATLLTAGGAVEAEQVYRQDLRKWPENGWSLFGLAQSLEAQGKEKEAARVRARFERVWQRADVKLTASCFCQAAR